MKKGILIINLGTPEHPDIKNIKRYLRVFLMDKRVINLPFLLRWILVNIFIIPTRSKKSLHAYQSIWTSSGSPLRVFTQSILTKLRQSYSTEFTIEYAMRYGNPSIEEKLDKLKECDSLCIIPLYPQYASSSSGTAIEAALEYIHTWSRIPTLKIIRDFHQHPQYIEAIAHKIQPHIEDHDLLLLSYHGLPKQHLSKEGCKTVCDEPCPIQNAAMGCYRAQCFETSRLIAESLNLEPKQYCVSFQSRVGRTPWIQPYTDILLSDLRAQGINNIAIACPSFVTDCLETLEEIGIQAQRTWQDLGGAKLTLIPCVNDDDKFIECLMRLNDE